MCGHQQPGLSENHQASLQSKILLFKKAIQTRQKGQNKEELTAYSVYKLYIVPL